MPAANTPVDSAPASAPLWRRFAAMLYDVFPLVGLWFVAALLWNLATGAHYDVAHPDYAQHGGLVSHVLLQLWLLVVTGAYFVLSWTRLGATIGMRAWKLRLVREDGSRVDVRTASVRFVLALLSLALLGGGFWVACFDRGRRTLHDRLCGTRMLRR